jgi:hypothetical protein
MAVLSVSAETNPTQRDRHIQVIAEQGRMAWCKKPRATTREPGLRLLHHNASQASSME